MKNKRWKPKEGDGVWAIDWDGKISIDTFYPYQETARRFGNCFRTRSAALKARKAVKKLLMSLPNK